MTEAQGAVTGGTPKTLAETAPEAAPDGVEAATAAAGTSDSPAPHGHAPARSPDATGVEPDHRLDASSHAHLLEEPLPPDAATETAIIYDVTLAEPHGPDAAPQPGPDGGPTPVTTGALPRSGAVRRLSAHGRADAGQPGSAGSSEGFAPAAPAAPATPAAPAAPAGATSGSGAGPGAGADTASAPGALGPAAGPSSPETPAGGDAPTAKMHGDAHRSAPASRVPTVRRVGAAVVVLLVAGLAGLAGYLWTSATEWRDQAGRYQRTASELGDELATTRSQLAGSQAELEAVRAQLSTAHGRIVELADEKNQALDDWEITQQLVDYQERVSEAAGTVALALDQCVQGQQELIGYLEQQVQPAPSTPPYDPAQLAQFETQVEALCQEASEANIALQLELAR